MSSVCFTEWLLRRTSFFNLVAKSPRDLFEATYQVTPPPPSEEMQIRFIANSVMNAQECTLEVMDVIFSQVSCPYMENSDIRVPPLVTPQRSVNKIHSQVFYFTRISLQRHSSFPLQGCMFYILLGFLHRMKAHNFIPLVNQGVRDIIG